MTRHFLEGALNGIGFVIGSAIVGLVLSALLILAHHLTAIVALAFSGVVLWFGFLGRRIVRTQLDRMTVNVSARALERQ